MKSGVREEKILSVYGNRREKRQSADVILLRFYGVWI